MFVPHAHAQTQALHYVSTRCRAQTCLRPKARLARRFTSHISASHPPLPTGRRRSYAHTRPHNRTTTSAQMQPTSPNGLRIAWRKRNPGCAQLPEAAHARTGASSAGVRGVANRFNAAKCRGACCDISRAAPEGGALPTSPTASPVDGPSRAFLAVFSPLRTAASTRAAYVKWHNCTRRLLKGLAVSTSASAGKDRRT